MAKHQLESMEISPAKNGGHVVRHRFKPTPVMKKGGMGGGMGMDYPQPEEHVFGPGDNAKVMAHVGKHLGLKGAPAAPPAAIPGESESEGY